MLRIRGVTGRKSALWVCIGIIVSFCALGIVRGIFTRAVGDYAINITVNDTSYGGLAYASDCNGTIYSSYNDTTENSWDNFPVNGGQITACPSSGYAFSHWLLDGVRMTYVGTTIGRWSSKDEMVYNSNKEMNLQAVFVPTYKVRATVDSTAGGTIVTYNTSSAYEVAPVGSNTNEIVFTVPDNGSSVATQTIRAVPDNGYVLDGVTTSGGVTYNRTENNVFTLTISGAGSAIVRFVQDVPTYTVTVQADNSSHGQISIPTSSGYTANPDNTASGSVVLTVPANTSPTTGTVSVSSTFDATVSPATGYYFTGFTSANNATTWTKTNNSADEYTLNLTGNDTVTANFRAYSDVIYTVSVNNPAVGAIDITGSNCATSTNRSFTKHLNPSIWYDSNNNPHLSYTNAILDTGGNDLVACVTDNRYRFSHWKINDTTISSAATLDDVGPWFKDGTTYTLEAVFVEDFYDVIFTTNGKGEIWMNNNKEYITLNPGSGIHVPTSGDQNLVATVDCNGNCSTPRNTNSLLTKANAGYRFHHIEISNNNATISSSTPSEGKYAFSLTGPATVTVIFGKYVNYEAGTIGTYTIDPVDPNNTSTIKTDEDAEGTVTGVTIDPSSIPVGAAFDHWEDANGNTVSTNQTFVPSGPQLDGEPTYHPVFRELTISYTSGTADNVTIPAIDLITLQTKTSESGLNPTGVTIDQSLIPSGWIFMGWADANDNIVTTGTNFIPTGASEVYEGATYHPVFTESNVANFTVNDAALGSLAYLGWGDKCTNGEAHATTVRFYGGSNNDVEFPANEIKACPESGKAFVGWSLDGGATIISTNEIANRWADYGWLNFEHASELNVTAVFSGAPVYTVGVKDKNAGTIDALGGSCGDSTNTNTDWESELVINGNSKTLGTNDDPNITSDLLACPNTGYQFAYWEIDYTIRASTNTTLARISNQWPSNSGSHSLRAVFSFPITYLDGNLSGTTIHATDPANPTTTKNSEQSTAITGATFNATELSGVTNAKFAGWEELSSSCTVPNCPIVSTNETFIPSGDQVYFGATYQPVFVVDNSYTEITSADPDMGYVSYWSGSQSAWVPRDDNGEFHVATVNGYVAGGIKAMPRDGYIFDHWEHNGTTICTRATSGCDEIVANEVAYQAGSGNSLPQLVAHFVPASAQYHVFTGYTGAYGYYDHLLPETQRPGGVGAQAGKITLTNYDDADSDIPGAYADFSGDQHATAPNGYYFAYWITGCNSDYNYSTLVTQNSDNQNLMNELGTETIVSFDHGFRPTRSQVDSCGEYIAVFYRKDQLRLIAQSENEAVGVVNATTTSTAQLYQDLCDNTLMRVKANLGVGVNASGYYSSCDATVVISNPAYKVSSWTFNGYTILDELTHEPVETVEYRGKYVVEQNGSYVSLGNVIVGDGLNYLVARFEILPLPFTGSWTIWLIVGGGVALVAIPSVMLLVSERKEQKKGGKK